MVVKGGIWHKRTHKVLLSSPNLQNCHSPELRTAGFGNIKRCVVVTGPLPKFCVQDSPLDPGTAWVTLSRLLSLSMPSLLGD